MTSPERRSLFPYLFDILVLLPARWKLICFSVSSVQERIVAKHTDWLLRRGW